MGQYDSKMQGKKKKIVKVADNDCDSVIKTTLDMNANEKETSNYLTARCFEVSL